MILFVSISSFWIKQLIPNGIFFGYSPIHLLIIFVIIQISLGIYFARVGNVFRHKQCMAYTYFGGLIIAGIFTFYPGRIMYKIFVG